MNYVLLKQVTRNFTRNRTRSNCARINYVNLCFERKIAGEQLFLTHTKDYFPHMQID
jgi:hypothetical protein